MAQLASASLDHSVMIWNFKKDLRAFRFVGHKGPVTSLDFARNGNVLASSSRDKTIRLWTPNVKGDVTVFKAHTGTVRSVQFSPDSEQLISCSDDKSIKIWSTHRTKFQFGLAGHMNWVRCAKFSPDARLVVSGSDDKSVKLWDLKSKTCVKTYLDHTGIVSGVAFHPSGTVVATCSMDRSIKLFDIRTHKLIQHYGDAHGASASQSSIEGNSGLSGGVNSINFGGKNGEWLISTGMDGVVKVWDVKEGHLFYTLHGHKNGPTTSAVFSPKGDFFATGGSDAQVMVWKSNFDEAGIDHDDIIVGRDGMASSPAPSLSHAGIRAEPPQKQFSKRGKSPHSRPPSSLLQNSNPDPIQIGAPIISSVGMDEHEKKDSATSPLQVQSMPDQIASTLSHIVRQIDILTQTMNILESRLTINEDRLLEMQKGPYQSRSNSPQMGQVYYEEAETSEMYNS